jgi:hypothetical protein
MNLSKADIESIKKTFRLYAPKTMWTDLKRLFDYIASLEKELGSSIKANQLKFIDNDGKPVPLMGSDGKPKGEITITKEYLKKRYE